MKRATSILLSFMYAIAVMGFTLSVHYCGAQVNSVTIGTQPKKCCCETNGKEAKDDGCCSNKVITAKVTDNHTPGSQVKGASPAVSDTAICYSGPGPVAPQQKAKPVIPQYYKNWHLPMGNPLYLRNRNILI